MPKCKNDPKKSYKGNEPSPKGLGYCAHVENLGVIKKGKDGNNWKIESTSKGIKRWVKINKKDKPTKLKCNNIYYFYNPKVYRGRKYVYYEENGYINKLIDYNKISDKKIKIPDNWVREEIDKDEIQQYYCGNKEYLDENNKYFLKINKKFKNCKYYIIIANYGTPFLVYVKNNEVHIYEFLEKKYYISIEHCKKWCFTHFLKKYSFDKIFIPYYRQGKNKNINLDGNSILIKNEKKNNKYTFIGGYEIYEFELEKDDEIMKLISECIPYQYAISKKYIYFLYEKEFIDQKHLPLKLDNYLKNNFDWFNYFFYYDKFKKNMKVKIIKKSNDILYLKD